MPKMRARKPQDVAAMIRAAREDAGLSQQQLAEQLTFSRDYMVDLESGRATVQAARLFRVLHELGVEMTLEYGHAEP
jgi:transcriptional regulator with XRE-family HTH domain